MDTQSLLSTEGSGKTCGHFWRNSYSKGFPSQPSGAPLPATAAQKPTPAGPGAQNSTEAFLQQTQEKAAREDQRNSRWEAWLFLAWGGAWLCSEGEMGKPSSSHSLSVLRLSQRPAWGLQKLMGQESSKAPFSVLSGARPPTSVFLKTPQ